MTIAYESLPVLSSSATTRDQHKEEPPFDFNKYMHTTEAKEKSLKNGFLYTTECMRVDGLWRLTKSPTCLEAEGLPPVGKCLALCSEEKRKFRQMMKMKSSLAQKIQLEDFPILQAKAQAALRDRLNCEATGLTSASLPFHARADLWRHPPPYVSPAIACRKNLPGPLPSSSSSEEGLHCHGLSESQEKKKEEELEKEKKSGEKVDPRGEEDKMRLKKSCWRTEASSTWGSALPREIHFPSRYHPTRTEFTSSLLSFSRPAHHPGSSSSTSLCTSIKHSRVPMNPEPLGGV